jgi:hypothetical protein
VEFDLELEEEGGEDFDIYVTTRLAALIRLLIARRVITPGELDKMAVRVSAELDQYTAEMRGGDAEVL